MRRVDESQLKVIISILALLAAIAAGYWYFTQPDPATAGRRGFGPVLVVAEPAQRQTLINSVEALGTARANESVTLTASLTDTVRRVNFDDGDYVEAGTVLVELTSEEEAAQLAEARANLDEAERQLRRLEDLDARGIAAVSDVDEARSLAEAAKARLNTVVARLKDSVIRAPFSGLLGFREVSPGTLLRPGDAITTIDDVSVIKLDFTVPETALGLIAPGRRIYARSASWGNRQFEGSVRAVGSRVDPVTRAVVVRAIIDNEDRALRPGMLLTVNVVAEEREALLIPERAVVQLGDGAFVYVLGSDGRAQRQTVELGARQAGTVEILSGIAEGDPIITEGVVKLRPGLEVRTQQDGGRQRVAAPGGAGQRPSVTGTGEGGPAGATPTGP